MITEAHPDAVVLLVAVELCSLTFLKSDFSKSNFVATSLFSDGIAAVIIQAKHETESPKFRIIASDSRLYYDTTDIMGWEFLDSGFKVVFSRDIPAFINQNVRTEVDDFLAKQGLKIEDIRNFIFHPGGKKVIDAYLQSLALNKDSLKQTSSVIRDYGNMSSPTVLYVLERFMNGDYEPGYGLMLALGPGFCTEMVLLSIG
jgi:alkylresorcinol/alkylpyrone synthase